MSKYKIHNPWLVCMVAASFFFYQYIQLTSFNVLKPYLMDRFAATSTSMNLVSSLYFYGTVAFLIPAGVMLDNLSTRLIILCSMAISLCALLLFIEAQSIYTLAAARFILGISAGPFCFLAGMRVASRWFDAKHMAFVTGLIVAMGMLGGILAQAPLELLISKLGFDQAMFYNLGFGIFLFFVMYLFIYDYPPGKAEEYKQELAYYKSNGLFKGLKKVIFSKQNWYASLFIALLNMPIFMLGALHGVVYLKDIKHLDSIQASLTCGMLFLGMLFGAPIFGLLSDKIRLRKLPMLLGLLICLAALVLVNTNLDLSYYTLMGLFFLIGFGSSAQTLVYPTIAESNPHALVASALSLASTLIMLSVAIIQPLLGALAENNKLVAKINILVVLLSALWLFLIKETYCQHKLAK